MRLIIIFISLMMSVLVVSAQPSIILSSTEENRALAFFETVRCPVCDGQPLAGSEAELSRDLQNMIRIKIKEGKTDDEIRHFLSQTYGEDILLTPPMGAFTFLLWYGPYIFLSGCFVIWGIKRQYRKKKLS